MNDLFLLPPGPPPLSQSNLTHIIIGIKYLLSEAPKISADGKKESPATRPPVFVITTKVSKVQYASLDYEE